MPWENCNPFTGPPVCRNLQTDSQNCGSCYNVCPSPATCVSGACSCPGEETFCPGTASWNPSRCTNLKTDNKTAEPATTYAKVPLPARTVPVVAQLVKPFATAYVSIPTRTVVTADAVETIARVDKSVKVVV